MKALFAATLIAGPMLVSGCLTAPVAPSLTPMEIQAMQSRDYEQPKEVVFGSVMSVFQDLGYTISSADLLTGFLTANSAATTQQASAAEVLFLGDQARQFTKQTRTTASVESLNENLTRVRLNFVVGIQASTGMGQNSAQDTPILDPDIYQNAFEKIEMELFVRSASSK